MCIRDSFRRAGKVQPEAGVQAEHVLLQFLRRRPGGDVYKRQAHGRRLLFLRRLAPQLQGLVPVLVRAVPLGQAAGGDDLHPVSYTHLYGVNA